MNIIEEIRKTVEKLPDKPVMVDYEGSRPMTYAAMWDISTHIAGKIRKLGINRGSFVLVNMSRRAEYFCAYLGILMAGCAVVPVVSEYPEERIAYISENCESELMITDDFLDDIGDFEPFCEPSDEKEPSLLIYTSGSTGKPKGILYSAADIVRSVMRGVEQFEGVSDIRHAGMGMFSFIVHITEYFPVFLLGGTVYILSNEVRRNIRLIEDFYAKHKITTGFISPQMLRLYANKTDTLKLVITGSERVSGIYYPDFVIENTLGMSELGPACMFRIDKPYDNTPVGKKLGEIEIAVMDENGNPLPDGQEGEINFIGNFDTVYYKNEEKTANTFVKMQDGRVRLKTGDAGFIDENGDLVYVNRMDWMVKINGQRVETLEIETLINDLDEIDASVVKAFEDEDKQTYLCAYFVAKSEITSAQIAKKLKKSLPDYMIPRFFVRLKELPKNLNGKVDRLSLLPPKTESFKAKYEKPQNETEEKLCSAFSDVLHCGKVGRLDDFFALGGDSVKALRLIESTGIYSLTPEIVLEGGTPEKIAVLLNKTGDTVQHLKVIPEITPLSSAQTGVYLDCIANPQSVMYNIAFACALPSDIDKERFKNAVITAAKNHKALFVKIGLNGDAPSMFSGEEKVTIAEREVCDIEDEKRDFVKPFDLENGPLFRFELCSCKNEIFFLADIHHIVFDGTSVEVFINEIADAYAGCKIQPEKLTLFDISQSEKTVKNSEKYAKAAEYFAQKLENTECDGKPVSDVCEEGRKGAGRVILSSEGFFTQEKLQNFAKKNKITENTLFLGAFSYALARMNGTNHSFFCTVNSGRHDPRLALSAGMFVKTLPMAFDFDHNAKITEFLPTVQEQIFSSIKHDCIDFAELSEKYGANTDILFVYQAEMFSGAPIGSGRMNVDMLDLADCECDLDFMLIKTENGYKLIADYRKNVYTEAFVSSFAQMYFNICAQMCEKMRLCDIELCTDSQTAMLDDLNRTEAPYDDSKTVVDLFREQAKNTPDNICLVFKEKRYTYKQVDEMTDRLAKYLVCEGIGREKVVGVLIPRCEYMLLCSLAVLKAGGAYLPLDPSYPPERLNLMVRDANVSLLFYAPELENIITTDFECKRVKTTDIPSLPERECELPTLSPSDLFVLLYTSGSTGTPKGVMFEHKNTLCTAVWVKKNYEIGESSRVTSYASYGFDAHAYDMYPAIIAGAELHIIAEDIRLDFNALREYFNDNGITHTVMTTQVGRQFAQMKGLSTLKCISFGGEKLVPLAPINNLRMFNVYGPTEGSIISTFFEIDKKYTDIPIGKPVDNLKAYIVAADGKRLPVGAVGELVISGTHVTRGYLNRPEKTAEAYGSNPFSTEKGYERIYRTGDIVRMLGDGNIQFVGRRDAQVKVRGFRVELSEIEEIIRRFPGISDATVAAFDDPVGGKYVAAYIVGNTKISPSDLSDFIRSEKPPYMVPAVIMQIDKIPLNQNQKVNKKALPAPKRDLGEIKPPENDTQRKIFDLVAEIVGHRAFGVDTDLFEAGLTSIGTVRLNISLSEAFSITVRISDIRENATVRKLEAFTQSAEKTHEYGKNTDYPITQTQNGIFIESMAALGSDIYNIPVILKLHPDIDISRLASAIKSAVNAHSYLKTYLDSDENGEIRAYRNDFADVQTAVIECESLPCDIVRPFDLLKSTLYRVEIYKTKNGNYLYFDCHHIICDGTSESILFRDISRAYAGETLKNESFSGFEAAAEEEKLRKTGKYDAAKAYWKNLLSGAETSCLPKKDAECEIEKAGTVTGGKTEAGAILSYCEKHGFTPNAYFNAVFGFVMGRFSNKEELTFSTVYNGRSDSRLANTVTLCAKTLPVVLDISQDQSVCDFVAKMQEQLISSMSNDICAFSELASDYGVKSDMIFVYQGESFDFNTLCGKKCELLAHNFDTAKAPVSVTVALKNGYFEFTAEYRRDIYNAGFAYSLCDALSQCALSFAESEKLSEVSMLGAEGEKLYASLNGKTQTEDGISFHNYIEDLADKAPDKKAIISLGGELTFRELDEQANKIANELIAKGVGRETIVGILLKRTADFVVAELAIMKAGGAFLPILPSYPNERTAYCLENSESPFVITTDEIIAQRPELFAENKPFCALSVEKLKAGKNKTRPNTEILPSQLAYCIYTSGSTGTPKGVMIEHHNLSSFIKADSEQIAYLHEESGSAMPISSFSFDMSLYDLYLPLCAGKTVYLPTDDELHDPRRMRDIIIDHNVRFIACTPSFLNNLISIPELSEAISNLRSVTVGAEAFPEALYDSLRVINPGLQIINGYGPTETTICCSTKELSSGKNITIGKPTANVRMFVLDKYGNILPPYAIGELIICGETVGRGYVKLPEKNAQSFFMLRGLRAYHSGDLVRLNQDGEIDFGGRIDNQVKLRGFRVELDEIEKTVCSYPGVKQSKVLVRNNGTEDFLACFFTASAQVDIEALKAHLKQKLTYYMVPSAIMQLDAMPLTPNGKIDKKAFPEIKADNRKKSGRKAPKKSTEQRLCEIFAKVLNLPEVFADDNFFELGGTSLTASKVTMMLMSENIEIKYGDIFDNPTPEELSEFIAGRGKAPEPKAEIKVFGKERDALKWNKVKYSAEVERKPLGNVLLTGAVGFLGIHVLKELIELESGHIYCLVRKGSHETAEIRLKAMLIYYFSDAFDDALRNRITVLDADITDESLKSAVKGFKIDTVINCAACVKHFSDSDILERINVHGVENLISLCTDIGAKLVHISTVSVPGIHTDETYEKQIKMHEHELFMIDDMSNKYIISKYKAELLLLDAIEKGLRAKIVRVGNLMGRHSDGEFQANLETNMFLSGIRGFATMGKYPISHMTDPMSFSPIDCTARAVVLLAGTNDKFTAFNANSRYGFDEMKIIDACNRNGIKIYPEQDEKYYEEFNKKLGDDGINSRLNGLAAYDVQDAHAVETDNLFTTNILYRIGFSWPLVDDSYLDRAINSIMTLDYFGNLPDEDEN